MLLQMKTISILINAMCNYKLKLYLQISITVYSPNASDSSTNAIILKFHMNKLGEIKILLLVANLKEIRTPISINDHTTIKLEMTIKKSILHFTLRKIKINSLK